MGFSNLVFYLINIIIIFVLFLFLTKVNSKIAEILDLYDFPSKQKIHKKKTPLIGVFTFFYFFFILHIYFFQKNGFEKDIFLILISTSLYFLIGLIDDKKNLSYSTKFFFFILISFFTIFFSDNLIIQKLYFETFDKYLYLNDVSKYIITILCILLLINATNLIDGINGLCIGIITFWFIYLIYKFKFYIPIVPLITILVLTLYYNFKGEFFLGNSGSHFFGCFIGLLLIYNYNTYVVEDNRIKYFSVEEIFILLMLPGIDMLRLFISRLWDKKNPFTSDLNHFHHYLLNNFKLFTSLFIYISFLVIPILVYNLKLFNPILIILITTLIYLCYLNIFLKKKIKKF